MAILGGIFWSGVYLGYQKIVKESFFTCPQKETPFDLSLFWEAEKILKENYVEKEKLDPKDLLYGAIKGMVRSLQDPYTVFFTPKESKRFLEDISGEFEGVGMEIGIRDGQLLVIAPLEGTPAFKAGLRAGDKIIKIDGKSTQGISLEEAVNLIRGPRGTKVVLTILRENWTEPQDFEIVRAKIEIPSLKLEWKENDIVYVKIYEFTEKADYKFRKAALQIFSKKPRGIILDLRNNPGGYLEVATNIAGWFLEKGKIVAIEEFGDGRRKMYLSPGPAKLKDYPLVILINEGSASGSEILAAALREQKGVILVGEKSFGKGSVQEMKTLSDKSSLKITVAKWLTPKGNLIEKKGLEPDIKVKAKEKDFEKGIDSQLEKALWVLEEILAKK